MCLPTMQSRGLRIHKMYLPSQPANVSGDETGRLVRRLRRQQISRDVQRLAIHTPLAESVCDKARVPE